MILVDTSVWINLLSKPKIKQLSDGLLLQLATCPPVVQEVLQGAASINKTFHDSFISLPILSASVSLERYIEASELFRHGRKKGYTIRSSIDCLIASIALFEKVPLWHHDRDFDQIAKFTTLEIFTP